MSNVAKVKSTFYFSFYIMLFSFVQFYCPLIFLDLVCTNCTAPTHGAQCTRGSGQAPSHSRKSIDSVDTLCYNVAVKIKFFPT